MKLCGMKLEMSSSRHPQADGVLEIMNRMIENYLRFCVSYRQNDRDDLLASTEYSKNSAVSDNLEISPFELDLGWKPKPPLHVMSCSDVSVYAVQELNDKLNSSLDDARFPNIVAEPCQAAEESQRLQMPEYKVASEL